MTAGAFTSNCSRAEALAWQGQPKGHNLGTPTVARHTATRVSLPSRGASAALAPNPPPLALTTAQQPYADGTAGKTAPSLPAVPSQQQPGPQRKSGKHERLTLSLQQQRLQQQRPQQQPEKVRHRQQQQYPPQQQQQQSMQLAEPAVELQPAGQASTAPRTRESLGGTQGAVAGLTHLSLQRHDEAMQQAAAAHSGLMPSEDTQALGLQVTYLLAFYLASQISSDSPGAKLLVAALLQPFCVAEEMSKLCMPACLAIKDIFVLSSQLV